jgi:methylenetetrahydrofolate dehydrogenase (NADP+)/methenyltetrahydrofolate cyclohydrolase
MYQLLDGKAISQQIKDECKERVAILREQGIERTLAVVQLGDDPASSVYVRNKRLACEYVGIKSRAFELPGVTSEEELCTLIKGLNDDDEVTGILVQLPLPEHIDEERVIQTISPSKDVDCFHPLNVGRLTIGQPGFLPCTPAGIVELLKRSDIEIAGQECVVIGRSNIVGKPLSLLLLRENATVTVTHSRTLDLPQVTRRADILLVAIGRPLMIGAEYVKEGAVVVDVGIHRREDGKLCGDVDFAAVAPLCRAITPVPGGVGPMTIAMLLKNILKV